MGGAAEFGAELRFSERVNLTADVRWIEIDEQADMIKSDAGLVGADPVSYGVSIGWRFR
jgi:outer membrane protein W